MTFLQIIEAVTDLKAKSTTICLEHGCTEVKWEIKDIDPSVIQEIASHYGVDWFKCGKGIACLLWSANDGSHISIHSGPIQVFEFINQTI